MTTRLAIRVPIELRGVNVGTRTLTASLLTEGDHEAFVIASAKDEVIAHGDFIGATPVVIHVDHDHAAVRGIASPSAAFARAITVALERHRRRAA